MGINTGPQPGPRHRRLGGITNATSDVTATGVATATTPGLKLVNLLALSLLAGLASPTLAQGMGGGMGGPGGGGPPGGPSRTATSPRETPPDIEDLLRPDPWRLWAKVLKDQRNEPSLAEVRPALDALLREVDDLQQLNEKRVRQAIRRQPPVISPQVDVARDLRLAAEDARDWLDALNAVHQRWTQLNTQLNESQRAQLLARYEDCWQGRVMDLPPGRR